MDQERTHSGLRGILLQQIDVLENEKNLFSTSNDPVHEQLGAQCCHELEILHEKFRQECAAKRIIVLGTFHELQKNGHSSNDEFSKRLLYLIRKFTIPHVMEEWSEICEPPFSAVEANAWGVTYMNVGTPTCDEAFQTITHAAIGHPSHRGTLPSDPDAPPELYEHFPIENQENRELRMLENIQAEMNPHQVGLFIVGLAHLHSMSIKLTTAGFNVASYHWVWLSQ